MSRPHATEWASLSGLKGKTGSVQASFLVDAHHARPTKVVVSYWNGEEYVAIPDAKIDWAAVAGKSTSITFKPVEASRIRLDLTNGQLPDSSG